MAGGSGWAAANRSGWKEALIITIIYWWLWQHSPVDVRLLRARAEAVDVARKHARLQVK